MKQIVISIFVIALSGCATSKQTFAPDGKSAHSIDCSGEFTNWSGCYEKAGELCKEKGYEIITGNAENYQSVTITKDLALGESNTNRNLLIKCK